jgi:hypothetical protein
LNPEGLASLWLKTFMMGIVTNQKADLKHSCLETLADFGRGNLKNTNWRCVYANELVLAEGLDMFRPKVPKFVYLVPPLTCFMELMPPSTQINRYDIKFRQ